MPTTPIDLRANAERLETRNLESADVRSAIVAAGLERPSQVRGWTLDALTVAAWQQRPEISQSRYLTAAVTADQAIATEPAPIGLSIIPEFVRQVGGGSPWSLMATLTWWLPNQARQAARDDGATATTQSATWQQAQMTWQITAEVRSAWMTWVDSLQAVVVAQEAVRWRNEQVQLAQKRVAVGYSPEHSVDALNGLQLQAYSDLAAALARQKGAVSQLARSCGLPSNGLNKVLLVPDAEPIATPDWSALGALATFNNLDLALALSKYAEAEAAEREQLSARVPNLTLGPGLGFDHGDHKWALAANIDLPSKTRRLAGEDAARARRQAAAAAVLAVQADRQSQLGLLRSEWELLQAQISTSEAVMATAQSATEALIKGWRAGRNSRDEVVDSELQVLQFKRDQEGLVLRQHALMATLEQIVQRPIWPASRLAPPSKIQIREEAPHVSSIE